MIGIMCRRAIRVVKLLLVEAVILLEDLLGGQKMERS
jgi:hypothetical protein